MIVIVGIMFLIGVHFFVTLGIVIIIIERVDITFLIRFIIDAIFYFFSRNFYQISASDRSHRRNNFK